MTESKQAARAYIRLTDDIIDRIVALIAATGSISEALRQGFGGDASTFYARLGRDITLKRRCLEAKDAFAASLMAEAVRRGRDGWLTPVFWQGQQIGVKREFDSHLLIAALRSADKTFIDKRSQSEINVHNADGDEQPLFSLSWSMAEKVNLDPVARNHLIAVLRWVKNYKREEAEQLALSGTVTIDRDDAITEIAADDPYSLDELKECF
jgi:hypothetical protein